MKIYANRNSKFNLEQLIGKDLWINVWIDFPNNVLNTEIAYIKLNRKYTLCTGETIVECNKVYLYGKVDSYEMSKHYHYILKNIHVIKPVQILTTEELIGK